MSSYLLDAVLYTERHQEFMSKDAYAFTMGYLKDVSNLGPADMDPAVIVKFKHGKVIINHIECFVELHEIGYASPTDLEITISMGRATIKGMSNGLDFKAKIGLPNSFVNSSPFWMVAGLVALRTFNENVT